MFQKTLYAILALLPAAGALAQTPPPADAPDATLTGLRNHVRLEGRESRDAVQGYELRRGHRVSTDAGASAKIVFSDGTRVQLGERSLLVIAGEDAGPGRERANDTTLLRGRLEVHIDAPAPGRPPVLVVIATPNVQVRMAPSAGVLEFDEGTGTRAAVSEGEWTVRARGSQVRVGAGFATRVEPGRAPDAPAPRAQPALQPAVAAPAMEPALPTLDVRLRDLELKLQELDALRAEVRDLRAMKTQLAAVQAAQAASAPEPSPPGAPWEWGDFSWLNGNMPRSENPLATRYFTPQADIDVNYTYSFNNPIDHTLVGSTATFRHNELELSYLGIGGDFHFGGARGRAYFQFGERAVAIPRNDTTPNHGQYDLSAAMRYLSEAYVGWHFDRLHGINVDLGQFFSYVGLFSYMQFENWGYQASFTSDNTPWFFVGNRTQVYPTDRLKVELWIINGWQTYGKFNNLPGFGFQIDWRPREWIKTVFSAYAGWDTQDARGRVRYHTDDSLLIRYYNRPDSRGLSRIASSLTFDLGGEDGGGVASWRGDNTPGNCTDSHPCEQDFLSTMLYFNFWYYKNTFSTLVGGGFMRNPGRYLVLTPTGLAGPGSPNGFSTAAGTTFFGWDTSQNISWYASPYLTLRLEHSFHHSDDPYYAGRGGVTGPDGYKCGGLYDPDARIYTCAPPGWKPDLVNNESKIMLIALFRL